MQCRDQRLVRIEMAATLAERARGYKMCQWDVREPAVAENVPLPPQRPDARDNGQIKKQ